MDMRERGFWLEEAAKARAERQLMAFEASSFPHLEKQQDRDQTRSRYLAVLDGTKPMTQQEISAANRARLKGVLGRRRHDGV